MQIQVSKLQLSTTREVFADIFWVENGQRQNATISIFYFPLTVAADIERRKQAKPNVVLDEKNQYQLADFCASRIEKIPDFVDEENKPIPLTKEFFENLHLDNLTAIYEAVIGDAYPKLIISPLPDTLKQTETKEASATSAKMNS
mgnify:CR=1 FL=1